MKLVFRSKKKPDNVRLSYVLDQNIILFEIGIGNS